MNHQNLSSNFKEQELQASALAVLELPPNASHQGIRTQFRRLALKYHPDKVYNNTEEAKNIARDRFSKISAAYELLTNGDKMRLENENPVLYASRFTDPYQLFQQHNLIHKSHEAIHRIRNPFQQPVAGYLTEFAAPIPVQQPQQHKRSYYEHFVAPGSPTTTAMYDENGSCLQNSSAKRVKVFHEDLAPLQPFVGRNRAKRDACWNRLSQNGHFEPDPKRHRAF
mmetsp:Transcript_26653/g.39429  ORF Transcript_26653/g.39429 Transcript_26653/m.39429 type:complete len:225 (-) Transcript_26653:152-826(-)|eukprot:CAMPEP_0194219400 /NCGR_PEP_ID=MMETSP0156-20130528/25844_1 /TAXON_ID=33649 /ORGANISM="Thalassionema nitzschioides, Strain L26-B" /LENGTH=224 /DNA_ID=CAMNT_0038949041 /DNA_START=78 /DNA_END=752 /DNA_ORIENTATION=+